MHGRTVFDTFETFYHEGTLWRGPIAVISFILTTNIHIYIIVGIGFITDISIKQSKQSILMKMVMGWNQNIFHKTGIISSFGWYPIQKIWDRYQKITTHNFWRKKINWIYLSPWLQIPWGWIPFEAEIMFTRRCY